MNSNIGSNNFPARLGIKLMPPPLPPPNTSPHLCPLTQNGDSLFGECILPRYIFIHAWTGEHNTSSSTPRVVWSSFHTFLLVFLHWLINFPTEYKIPGTPSPDGKCIFTYYSSSRKEGTFNSPRHPANYPSNTTCEYTFQANPDEQVRLAFSTFELRSEKNNLTYGWVFCFVIPGRELYMFNGWDLCKWGLVSSTAQSFFLFLLFFFFFLLYNEL